MKAAAFVVLALSDWIEEKNIKHVVGNGKSEEEESLALSHRSARTLFLSFRYCPCALNMLKAFAEEKDG